MAMKNLVIKAFINLKKNVILWISSFPNVRKYFEIVKNRYILLPSSLKKIIKSVFAIFALFQVLNLVFPLKTHVDYSTIVLSNDSTLLHAFLTRDDQWRMYTEIDEITPELRKAIVYKEDRFFYWHLGINPVSIARALFNNIRHGKRTSGASTITMQVARLLSPKDRTYANKLVEMFRALQLEWKFSKKEILQLYLNLVPYGSNIEGVKSASVLYFGKMPNHLSIAEIAALSIIPNRPVSLRLGKNNGDILQERNKWLEKYKKARLFKKEYIDDAIEEPLTAYRHDVPRLAPQLSYRLKSLCPNTDIIHTTIDLEMQRKCEQLVFEYSKRLYFQNIKNATAIIIDNKTRNVLAYVGSADYSNSEDGGQVDGIRAVRSPGSALKPLLYALAFDEGLITPKTIISDVRTSFAGYEPENYDSKFNGNISIEKALEASLNVPAVKVLDELSVRKFVEGLIKAGFNHIENDRDNLGLSAILGGCGVTSEELTNLYCTLANNGGYKPLNFVRSHSASSTRQVVSPGAAFAITEILTKIKRPDLPVDWANSTHMPQIAWKTGTSYGRKDAWSIGYNNNYTVGIWVGNFSGEGVPELSGAEKATPLLFQVFNAIDYNSKKEWFSMPDDISIRYVCSQSGNVPNTFCSDLVLDYYIPGVSPNTTCDHLKKVLISADSTVSYCTSCCPSLGYIEAYYPNLSPEIITYFEDNLIQYQKIPPHNPKCERMLQGENPKITSPINDNDYYVNVNDSMQIMLSCHVANDVEKVFWYINKQFFKSANKGENIFFVPSEGSVEISCSDDKGRNTTITIRVKYADL
jgi:penicillin-binding protein 1C